MAKSIIGVSIFVLVLGNAASATGQTTCTAPAFTDKQIVEIIAKGRSRRTDLPLAYADYTTVIVRRGCHYEYTEHREPRGPGGLIVFLLNQLGQIVDVERGY